MADRPILFSGAMIRALLAGTKTQTRRIVSGVPDQPVANCHPMNTPRHPAPYLDSYCGQPKTAANPRGMSNEWMWWQVDDRPGYPSFKVKFVPGDRLWVREAWRLPNSFDEDSPVRAATRVHPSFKPNVFFEADGAVRSAGAATGKPGRLRASMHMPRWASRLTLPVADVRVQRLQDISEEDARAEGAELDQALLAGGLKATYRGGFARIWAGIHEPHPNNPTSWGNNPWVAAYTFSVERRNIDAEVRHDL